MNRLRNALIWQPPNQISEAYRIDRISSLVEWMNLTNFKKLRVEISAVFYFTLLYKYTMMKISQTLYLLKPMLVGNRWYEAYDIADVGSEKRAIKMEENGDGFIVGDAAQYAEEYYELVAAGEHADYWEVKQFLNRVKEWPYSERGPDWEHLVTTFVSPYELQREETLKTVNPIPVAVAGVAEARGEAEGISFDVGSQDTITHTKSNKKKQGRIVEGQCTISLKRRAD